MKSSARNIQMTSYDDLFSVGDAAGTTGEKVQEIALGELFPFKGHPFKVLDDEAMEEMVESIGLHGVLVPGIARPRAEGGYELLAGHRRRHALELAGETMMPVIIRELDDDESTLFMVDSNLQRENLLPSEKAWAYKMKLEAIRRKAGRPAGNNSGQVVQNLKRKFSVEIIADESGENYKQVQRYIRLTELLAELLQMVDDKKLLFNPAVELSYLTKEEQRQLLGLMGELVAVPSLDFADSHHRFDQCGIVMYLDSENWLKASVEYENEEYQHLGSVVTNNGYSDWATTAIGASVKTMWYRFSRREDDYCIECSTDGVAFSQMRICHMHNGKGKIRFGIYACSPEESSFKAVFSNMQVMECQWRAHDGQQPDSNG